MLQDAIHEPRDQNCFAPGVVKYFYDFCLVCPFEKHEINAFVDGNLDELGHCLF